MARVPDSSPNFRDLASGHDSSVLLLYNCSIAECDINSQNNICSWNVDTPGDNKVHVKQKSPNDISWPEGQNVGLTESVAAGGISVSQTRYPAPNLLWTLYPSPDDKILDPYHAELIPSTWEEPASTVG